MNVEQLDKLVDDFASNFDEHGNEAVTVIPKHRISEKQNHLAAVIKGRGGDIVRTYQEIYGARPWFLRLIILSIVEHLTDLSDELTKDNADAEQKAFSDVLNAGVMVLQKLDTAIEMRSKMGIDEDQPITH